MSDAAKRWDETLDFLTWEERQPERWERLHGVVRMMVGGTLNHNRLCRALARALEGVAPSCCEAFIESVKLKIGENWLYPDVLLLCPPPPGTLNWVDHAVMVAEIDSPSNSPAQQRRKLALYQSLPGLQAIVHLAQDEMAAQLFRRQGEDWVTSLYFGPDAALALPGCAEPLRLGPLYDRLDLAPGDASDPSL